MSKAVTTLGVISVALAGACTVLAHRVWTDHKQLADSRMKISQLETALAARPAPVAPLPVAAPSAQVAAAPEVPSAAQPVAGGRKPEDAFRAQIAQQQQAQREAMKNPEYRAKLLEQQKLMMMSQLMNLPSWVQMPEALKEQLATLMAEQSIRQREMFMTAMDPQSTEGRQRRMQQVQQMQQENAAQIEQLLGYERNERWKEYQETRGARMQLSMLQSQFGTDPLPEEKLRPFAKAFAQAQRTAMNEFQQQGAVDSNNPAAAMERMVAMQRRTNELTRDAAKQFLSAKQLQAFDTQQAQQQAQIEAGMKLQQITPGPAGGFTTITTAPDGVVVMGSGGVAVMGSGGAAVVAPRPVPPGP